LRAAGCASPRLGNGEAGAGLRSAWIRAVAAALAALAEEVFGIRQLYGEKETVSEWRSEVVLEM
jgi:hypothetical protein